MKVGDYVYTPRFCSCEIKEIFENKEEAMNNGYIEPTHYNNPDYDVFGKHIGINMMVFAGVKK